MRAFVALSVTVLAAIAIGVGLGGSTSPTTPSSTSAPARPDSDAPTLGLAAAYARSILGTAPVPSGLSVLHTVPSGLTEVASVEAIPGLIDLRRFYASDLDPNAVLAAIERQLPAGARVTSRFSGTVGTAATGLVATTGIVVTLVTRGVHRYLAQLVYECAAAAGTGTYLRLDAQTVWIGPRTVPLIGSPRSASVTGYGQLSLALGPSQPVALRLGRSARRALVAELNSLPAGVEPDCMESVTDYTISLVMNDGVHWTITDGCAQSVLVERDAQWLAPLGDPHCGLLDLVATELPSTARATQAAATNCKLASARRAPA